MNVRLTTLSHDFLGLETDTYRNGSGWEHGDKYPRGRTSFLTTFSEPNRLGSFHFVVFCFFRLLFVIL